MALEKDYHWYIENGQIAIVEPNSGTTGTDWKAISTADKTVKVFAERYATDFDTDLTDDGKTVNIPDRFRRAIADLVISWGYERLPNQDIKLAGHFYNKYKTQLREMKKMRNSNYRRGGVISPWYY